MMALPQKMTRFRRSLALACGLNLALVACVWAQPPRGPGQRPPGDQTNAAPPKADGFIARMLTFDANDDGKLAKSEITDNRLAHLFQRADANRDGVVTKEELTALHTREAASLQNRRGPRGFGPGGPGPGGPGRGPVGPGGNPPPRQPRPSQP